MRKVLKYIIFLVFVSGWYACSIEEDPIGDFSDITIGGKDNSSVKFATKAQMATQYEALYTLLQGDRGLLDWSTDLLVVTETHSDNAYRGATDAELTQLEQQKQNGINKNIDRDWDGFYKTIGATNRVICNVDSVPDKTLTAAERKQWKSEALILRSWIYFDMVRLWGGVPLVITEPEAINAANIERVYPLYYPARNTVDEVYSQIIKDLNFSLEDGGAPNIDANNKFRFSKTVANALLAKIYAEKAVRDYNKVVDYCTKVETDVSLVPNYGDLFDVNVDNTDAKSRHTSESIFEIPFSGGGNWNTWLFGVDVTDPNSKYDWAKWLTPSRDLIAAFDKEGDVVRKKATIIFASVSWSNHYPSANYPFMHKMPSKFNSVIKLRLGDILLLKAEALTNLNRLPEAAALVNKIRRRAKLPDLTSSDMASQQSMLNAVLKERRLELAFEGQRWFDLVRTGKVFEVMNTLKNRDSGRLPMDEVTENSVLLPIPQSQIDFNPQLVQNPGY